MAIFHTQQTWCRPLPPLPYTTDQSRFSTTPLMPSLFLTHTNTLLPCCVFSSLPYMCVMALTVIFIQICQCQLWTKIKSLKPCLLKISLLKPAWSLPFTSFHMFLLFWCQPCVRRYAVYLLNHFFFYKHEFSFLPVAILLVLNLFYDLWNHLTKTVFFFFLWHLTKACLFINVNLFKDYNYQTISS